MLRVLLAEDYPFFREIVRQVLAADPEVAIVGEAEEPGAIMLAVQSLAPDVVLLDTSLPGASGLHVAAEIRRRSPHVRVIVLGDEEMDEYRNVAVEGGIAAYVLKWNAERELLQVLRKIPELDQYL